jgi:NitT/TauT family transport system substrate-binding protein
MLTPEVAANGMGDVSDARMRAPSAAGEGGVRTAARPAPAEVFDRRFLPPLAERKIAAP